MDDDLNTPQALALLREALKSKNLSAKSKLKIVKEFDQVLGLDLLPMAKARSRASAAVPAEIKQLAQERWRLKLAGNYSQADRLRLELAKKGYELQDNAAGYKIKRKS
ncbi:MAG: hypothetical protein Q8L21_01690 [Candidatus Komeilibacteria bacterium]|nr:hypothetical protein [Candidatus Komeilibacteria bacterium]